MAFVIAQPCVGVKDTACVVVCPVDVIHPTKDEADFVAAEQLYIDPVNCIGCGLCVGECPVAAIFPIDDVPAEWQDFIERNAAHYRPLTSKSPRPSDPRTTTRSSFRGADHS